MSYAIGNNTAFTTKVRETCRHNALIMIDSAVLRKGKKLFLNYKGSGKYLWKEGSDSWSSYARNGFVLFWQWWGP